MTSWALIKLDMCDQTEAELVEDISCLQTGNDISEEAIYTEGR